MARPTYETLSEIRTRLANRVGFGGMPAAAQNVGKLNGMLQDAQRFLWRRIDHPAVWTDDLDKWVAPTETSIAYPSEIDPDRIYEIAVDYSGSDEWYPLTEHITLGHDSVADVGSWPRRFDRMDDVIELWPVADAAATYEIVGITQANPGVVTIEDTAGNAPAGPALQAGQRVYLKSVQGMVEVTDGVYVVGTVSNGGKSFELKDSDGVDIDTSGFTAWSSGSSGENVFQMGWRLRFTAILMLGAFASDSDPATLPDDLVFLQALVYAKAEYRHPDVKVYENELRRLMNRIRGAKTGTRRFVPRGRNGRGPAVEHVRPRLINE